MSVGHTTEKDFEAYIEKHLVSTGYQKRNKDLYDKNNCLLEDDVIDFIRDAQPKEYEKLEQAYGSDVRKNLIYRLDKEIARKGTLRVLRGGISDRDASIKLTYFMPSSGLNPEHEKLYKKNKLSVVRQLKYSTKNENSVDIVLFLNGLPIITIELKNALTGQYAQSAIKQYNNDRNPKDKLFRFKRCLVHFALGSEKVFMTTKLNGELTDFLPFNRDFENPVNPDGYMTSYLWEEILHPDSLMELICNYLHLQSVTQKYYDEKAKEVVEKSKDIFIFPRFHQLSVVKDALSYAKESGPGHNYLVQHSAGSGKSNSIAWLVHQLASLYESKDAKKRIFDSIIVLTDRRILDRQLQNTIKQFEQTAGVVEAIDMNSKQLKKALETGKDIIISTIQKFPVISGSMIALRGKNFAVIVDEAHSSQSGESAKHVKKVLTTDEVSEEEETVEDKILKEMDLRGPQPHISYFGFTATPKNKTLELFGRNNEDPNAEQQFVAHHVYSMRQAIEEGFILDVLKNYTTYNRYFRLIKTISGNKEYEKKKAIKELMKYVEKHPHHLQSKAEIILDHFRDTVHNSIDGKGRAMLVTSKRLLAVRFQLIFQKLIKEKNLPFKTLVAFSGTVTDPDSNEDYTERSMNGLQPKVKIEDAFKTPEYRMLIVANKFQTGFDEPFLHTMYVDKFLAGTNAVQTLSRLNRKADGKDEVFVFDFQNQVEKIQSAFQAYYQTTFLEQETDPNRLHEIREELLEYEIYSNQDVNEFADIFFPKDQDAAGLQPILDDAAEKFRNIKDNKIKEEFRSLLRTYVNLYGYISQVIDWHVPDLEKLYVYSRYLNRKLPKRERTDLSELQDAVDLNSFRVSRQFNQIRLTLEKEDTGIPEVKASTSTVREDEKVTLSKIISNVNDTYGLELTEEDIIYIEEAFKKTKDDEEFIECLNPQNTVENIKLKFDQVFDSHTIDIVEKATNTYKKISEKDKSRRLRDELFNKIIEPMTAEMGTMQKKLDDPNSIENLIASRETQRLEKKSSLRWSYNENVKDKTLESIIMKTIAGFNNSDGGQLIIGVDDDGNILGLDNDYSTLQKQDNDGFSNHLIRIIENNFGIEFSTELVSTEWIEFPIIEEKEICAINISRGDKPTLLVHIDKNGQKSKILYRRLDGQTIPIQDSEQIFEYIKERFPDYKIDEEREITL